jgi:bifunctional DNA-binding transcriptional regulator/antitoxin component of YhaV-PrlF toxin-antitoxin module
MGKRGTVVVPAKLRKRLGLDDGCLLSLLEKEDCFEIRKVEVPDLAPDPASAKRTQAAQILSGASNLGEYLAALEEVQRLGFDPDEIPHERFSG